MFFNRRHWFGYWWRIKLDKIFSKYEQENERVRKQYGGTGLGLNISQLFVEKNGGEIKVESELGKGSKFTLMYFLKNLK